MHLIYDIYLICDGRRGEFYFVTDVADFVYAVIRRLIYFNHICYRAVCDPLARRTFIAGLF